MLKRLILLSTAISSTLFAHFEAEIQYTQYGIPHIKGSSMANASFGQGYACAKDNLPVLAKTFLTVRSELAEYLGAGKNETHLRSDLGLKAIKLYSHSQELFAELPEEQQAILNGYAAGYNLALRERESPEAWMKEATGVDVFAQILRFAQLRGAAGMAPFMVGLKPPQNHFVNNEESIPDNSLGSNGWAIGAERSANGRGMLFANPHFPWEGDKRFYACHLQVPGELNVAGASLLGMPSVVIGFTDKVAWTHTVSTTASSILYRLQLKDGKPHKYLYNGQEKEIEAFTEEVKVRMDSGRVVKREMTFYRSHLGILVNMGPLGWSKKYAYALCDVTEMQTEMVEAWLKMAQAKNVHELEDTLRNFHCLPWVNTMATDMDGNALYANYSGVPQLDDRVIPAFVSSLYHNPMLLGFLESGVAVLDGSSSRFALQKDSRAVHEGITPTEELPYLLRRDFVQNANQSHWMTNPLEPLVGYSPLAGLERQALSTRTKRNLQFLMAKDQSGQGVKFNRQKLREIMLDNHSQAADLFMDDLTSRCYVCSDFTLPNGEEVDISQVGTILKNWDRSYDLDSRGGLLFREIITQFRQGTRSMRPAVFGIDFNPNKPLSTPSGMLQPKGDLTIDPVLVAVAKAVKVLNQAGIPLDGSVRDHQFAMVEGKAYPLHGAGELEGVINTNKYKPIDPICPLEDCLHLSSGLTSKGYPINWGTSFALVVDFTDEGPEADVIVTYSQGSDPESPHFMDQYPLYLNKEWISFPFTDEDIAQDPALRSMTIRSAS